MSMRQIRDGYYCRGVEAWVDSMKYGSMQTVSWATVEANVFFSEKSEIKLKQEFLFRN
jgi:hypothetical protein